MSLPQEVLSQGSNILPIAAPIVIGGGVGVKCVQTIPKGYVGLRNRFGNPSTVEQTGDNQEEVEANLRGFVTPGRLPAVHFPFTHNIDLVSVQSRPMEVTTQVDCADGKQRDVMSKVEWGIKPNKVSAYRALYVPQGGDKGKPDEDHLVSLVEGVLTNVFLEVMTVLPENKGLRDQEHIESAMYWLCADGLSKFGAEVRGVQKMKDAKSIGQMLIEARLPASTPDTEGSMETDPSELLAVEQEVDIPNFRDLRVAAQ